MPDEDRDNVVDRISQRFDQDQDESDGDETTETSETSETTETGEKQELTASTSSETTETTDTMETSEATGTTGTSETLAPGDEEFELREHWNGRTIYLPDDDVEDLDLLYQEVGLEWRREHGGKLPKNERFYPAVVRVALNHPDLVREELGLDE